MSELSRFFKSNKQKKPNAKVVVSKEFVDEKGNYMEWEIKPISTKEFERIRKECNKLVPSRSVPGKYENKFDSVKYNHKIIVASVVFPDLRNQELLDSYNVMAPEDLIDEMLTNAGDYSRLMSFIENYNGFTDQDPLSKDVKKAKN